MSTQTAPADQKSMTPIPYIVERTYRENHDTVTLALTPEKPGQAIDGWRPGQFTMLYAFGVGEIPVSISGNPERDGQLMHTVRDVGAVSHAITALRPGAALGVRGPFGLGWRDGAVPDGKDLLIVAGGLGLAPVRPLITHAALWRAAYRRVQVVIGARTPADLLYTIEYDSWRAFGLDVLVTVDDADETWRGLIDLVTAPLEELVLDPLETSAFVCGPEVMMTATARALIKYGVPDYSICVSLERSMKCGIGVCGHCQMGPLLICRDGPCFRYDEVATLLDMKEL